MEDVVSALGAPARCVTLVIYFSHGLPRNKNFSIMFGQKSNNKKEMSFRNLQRQCIKCSSGDVQYLALYLERWSHYSKKCLSCTLTPRFPGKSHFLGSHISWEVTFPGNHISREVAFPGIHISREVTIPGNKHFP